MYRHKIPCRHVRTCFRERRFSHNVLVPLCTRKYYSSTTLYYKVLRQYSSALQSTSPALLPTIQYYNRARTSARNTRSSASSTSASTSSTSTSSTTSASKMPILPQFRAIGTHDLTKGLHSAPQNRNFTTVSCDRHARSYERVALSTAKSQFYYSFVRSTRSILRKGCTQHRKIAILLVSCDRHARSHERVHPAQTKSQFYYSFVQSTRTISRKGSSSTNEIAILLQFRAIDTHDLTKGFIQHKRNRNFTTVSRDRHARSYERVHRAQTKSQFYRSFARSTRTILGEGCISANIFRTMAAPPPSLLNN